MELINLVAHVIFVKHYAWSVAGIYDQLGTTLTQDEPTLVLAYHLSATDPTETEALVAEALDDLGLEMHYPWDDEPCSFCNEYDAGMGVIAVRLSTASPAALASLRALWKSVPNKKE